jgi:hypothetical protein
MYGLGLGVTLAVGLAISFAMAPDDALAAYVIPRGQMPVSTYKGM